jgi:L,D-transpeptidase YcbB
MRTISLILVAALAACGTPSSGADTTPPPGAAPPATTVAPPATPTDEIRGERLLEPDAVDRFYLARTGSPAWTRPGVLDEVIEAIEASTNDGLNPADYHRDVIAKLVAARARAATPDPALDADLDHLVTDAVAALIDHVRYGRVRPIELDPLWNVDPRDGAPALEKRVAKVAAAASPKKAIDAARPDHFIYRGLVGALAELRAIEAKGGWPMVATGRKIKPGMRDARIPTIRKRLAASGAANTRYDTALAGAVKAFQAGHRLEPTGVIDADTIDEMNVSASARADQVRANLERARWVLHDLTDDFILVNLPAYKAYLIRDDKKVWETRTMIGKEARQSPTFRATMRSIVLNPDWKVPHTILAEDVIEGMRRGNDVLARQHLVVVDAKNREIDPATIDWDDVSADSFPYIVRQPAGPLNVLGRVKFEFPNQHAIYMHDTPSKQLFELDDRAMSSGCIRIERPFELAALLLAGHGGWTRDKIKSAVATGETRTVKLHDPIPVLIVYWTVSVGVGASGEIRYARDVYKLDGPLLAALSRPATH